MNNSGSVAITSSRVANHCVVGRIGSLSPAANFIGSLFGFYLSVVFSVTLGLAIYKASDRLQLFKG